MPARTTTADLDRLARMIGHVLDAEHTIEHAYGQPRLFRAGGSIEVSPRLSAGELLLWMRAYYAGIIAGQALPLDPQLAIERALELAAGDPARALEIIQERQPELAGIAGEILTQPHLQPEPSTELDYALADMADDRRPLGGSR